MTEYRHFIQTGKQITQEIQESITNEAISTPLKILLINLRLNQKWVRNKTLIKRLERINHLDADSKTLMIQEIISELKDTQNKPKRKNGLISFPTSYGTVSFKPRKKR